MTGRSSLKCSLDQRVVAGAASVGINHDRDLLTDAGSIRHELETSEIERPDRGHEMMADRSPSLTKQDAEHLRILMILHYVVAALAFLGLGFMALHYMLLNSLMANVKGQMPPPEFLLIFRLAYAVFGVFSLIGGICSLVSASNLRQRRNRTLSLIVAGFNCLQIPFGTTLGVFTFIVLTRDSVREVYEHTESTSGWFEEQDSQSSP